MRFVIVTGMSGAGKSTALKMLEDMGYFCVDNLPIPLLPGFVQMLQNTDTEMKKVALGRAGKDLCGWTEFLQSLYYGYVVWVQIWDSAGCGSCL